MRGEVGEGGAKQRNEAMPEFVEIGVQPRLLDIATALNREEYEALMVS